VAALALDVHLALDLLLDLAVDDPLRPKVAMPHSKPWWPPSTSTTWSARRGRPAALAPVFDVPSAPGAHRLVAVGHAHLDTAWLWPLRETHRKVVRTFANAVDLLDRYPDHRFAHSQAVHYAWVAEDHPDLFERVKSHVAAGRWEPVGGMWVEADLNLSGGESLVRQLLHGQRSLRGLVRPPVSPAGSCPTTSATRRRSLRSSGPGAGRSSPRS
jgi:alpha-mannosidase